MDYYQFPYYNDYRPFPSPRPCKLYDYGSPLDYETGYIRRPETRQSFKYKQNKRNTFEIIKAYTYIDKFD